MGKVKRAKDGEVNGQGREKEGRGAPAPRGATDRQTDHATRSVTIGRIYVVLQCGVRKILTQFYTIIACRPTFK